MTDCSQLVSYSHIFDLHLDRTRNRILQIISRINQYIMSISQLELLPVELLLEKFLSLEPQDLQHLRVASPRFKEVIDGNEDYLVSRILARGDYPEALLFEKGADASTHHLADTTLGLAVACLWEMKLLLEGQPEMEIGILQKLQLPPSWREKLKDLITDFSLTPGLIIQQEAEFEPWYAFHEPEYPWVGMYTNLKDVVKVNTTSFRRAASRPEYITVFQDKYDVIKRRGLRYACFLQALNKHINQVFSTIQEPYYGSRGFYDAPTSRSGIVGEFLYQLHSYGIRNPELGFNSDYLLLWYHCVSRNWFTTTLGTLDEVHEDLDPRVVHFEMDRRMEDKEDFWMALVSEDLKELTHFSGAEHFDHRDMLECLGCPPDPTLGLVDSISYPDRIHTDPWFPSSGPFAPEEECWEPFTQSDVDEAVRRWGEGEWQARARCMKLKLYGKTKEEYIRLSLKLARRDLVQENLPIHFWMARAPSFLRSEASIS